MPAKLTHLDDKGEARMVDVSGKEVTRRRAEARGRVTMAAETLALIRENGLPKGDVLAAARLAGIMAAKKTGELIPLCHPLPLDEVSVAFSFDDAAPAVDITATATVTGRTGVEMEALTAVSVAALTLYDMCKAVDKAMRIGDIRLTYKEGGRSGVFKGD